jgi:tol-pal system protein YbgF
MRRFRALANVLAALAFFGLSACEPYTYMPARPRTAPPPAAGPATASPPAGAMPGAGEQLRALESRVQDLESRLAALEQGRGAPMVPAPLGTPSPEAAAPPPSTPVYPPPAASPADDKAFNEGMGLYRDKKYEAARQKFYQYLKKSPRGPKAAEARYYLADGFYQEKRFQEAAVEFNKLVNLHPESVLAPTALLRQALSYQQLQQQSNYKIALNKLVKSYPQSPEAQEAKKRLGTAR